METKKRTNGLSPATSPDLLETCKQIEVLLSQIGESYEPRNSTDELGADIRCIAAICRQAIAKAMGETQCERRLSTKHTPGPWRWVENDCSWPCSAYNHLAGASSWILVVKSEMDSEGVTRYGIGHDLGSIEDERCKADFALIAAAPDLLEMCETINDVLIDEKFKDLKFRLQQVINKAKGEQEC